MSSLYEITGDYLRLQELLESGDYTEEELADTLEAIDGELEAKAEGYGMVIRNIEAEIAACKEEEKRIADRRKTMESNVSRIKSTLQQSMTVTGKKKISTPLFSFTVRTNGGKQPLVIDEQYIENFPEQFTVSELKLNNDAIRKALDAGEDLEGLAHYGKRSESLVIR